jgi:hypothetical protein
VVVYSADEHGYLSLIQCFLSYPGRNHGIQPDSDSPPVLTALGVRNVCGVQDLKVILAHIPSFADPERLASRHSDSDGERFLHIAVPLFLGIVGFLMAMLTMNTAIRYMSLSAVLPISA